VESLRQVALGNPIVVAYDPQASGLTGEDVPLRHGPEHQLAVKAHRFEERVKDLQGEWIHPADFCERWALEPTITPFGMHR
jgi:hypothetical protein